MFSIKKSTKGTFVEIIEIFKENKNKIIIKVWIINFFKGFFIINKSEKTPKKNKANKKMLAK